MASAKVEKYGTFVAKIRVFGSSDDFAIVLEDPEYLEILKYKHGSHENELHVRPYEFKSYWQQSNFGELFTSSRIILLDREVFLPGETGIVLMYTMLRGINEFRYKVGSKFLIHEVKRAVGVGQVLAIVNFDEGIYVPSMGLTEPTKPTSAS